MNIDRNMLKQALQNKASCNAIAEARGISHHTVRRSKRILESAGVSSDKIDEMTDSQLSKILYPKKRTRAYQEPDCEKEYGYMEKGYNLTETHARYMNEVGIENALKYSAYCDRMRAFGKKKGITLKITHPPGYVMQVDYAGYRPVGLENGTERKFELFVAVLPASHHLFAIVVRSQSTSDFIRANIAALEYFNGVPETICPDNLKAAIIRRPRKAAPDINPAFLQFADYYGMRVTPARVRHPKDKAAVEVAVKLVQRILKLKIQRFPNLELSELNETLSVIVNELNRRPMKRVGESRLERFKRLDSSYLQPLPMESLKYLEPPVERLVSVDHHIAFDNVNYSVPFNLVGKIVSVRASQQSVEIRHDGHPVALHPRSFGPSEYVTEDVHRTKNHRAFIDQRFADWRATLPDVINLIIDSEIELSKRKLGKERLMGKVRKLSRDYGVKRLITACEQAISNNYCTLQHVSNLLSNNLDLPNSRQDSALRGRMNVSLNLRGSAYFDKDFKPDERKP